MQGEATDAQAHRQRALAKTGARILSAGAGVQTTAQAPTQASLAEPTVAIIGYGVAGVNALIALRTAGFKGKIRVFSDTNTLPYSPLLTSYYAGGETSYEECFPWSAEELDALGGEVWSNCPVTWLDPEAHRIYTSQGTFAYTKCLIASGATPTGWNVSDVGGYKPLVLRTMDDAERLKAATMNPGCKRVLISGASMIALKILEACLQRNIQTTLIGMSPHLLDFNALPETAVRFEKGLREKGVQLRLGQTITAVKVAEDAAHPLGRVLEVVFSTGELATFDEIAVAHGVSCNLDFVAKGSLKRDRALLVNNHMRTSNADIYAAGDVAQAVELISGQKRIVGIWKNAAVQGFCAGRAIAAELAGTDIPEDAVYKGSISANTIAVNGTLFISAGTMEVTPSRHIAVQETSEMTVLSLSEDLPGGGKRLVGFNLVCDTDEAGSKAYDTAAMLTLRIEKAL